MKKATSRAKNAILHGCYATDLLLPWESRKAFDALHAEFIEEFDPQTPIEREMVLDLARYRWLKRRVMRGAQLRYRADPLAIELKQSGAKGVNQLSAIVRKKRKEEFGPRHAIVYSQEAIETLCMKLAISMEETFQGKKTIDDFKTMTKTLFDGLKNCVELEKSLSEVHSVFERAYLPRDMETLVRIEAALDLRFEKALSRLIQYREFRKINKKVAPKLVNAG
jgi:hypothetical protein